MREQSGNIQAEAAEEVCKKATMKTTARLKFNSKAMVVKL